MNNILITSAGRRVSLVRFFQKELKRFFPEAKVFTTDLNPDFSAACAVSDKAFAISRVTDPNYIDQLLTLAKAQKVGMIIPTIDTELLVLAQNRELFKQNGIEVIVSDESLVSVFRDKRKTHTFFDEHNIGRASEFSKTEFSLPIYIKPYDGSRSVDNYVILSENQLTDYHFANEKLMFLEYLEHSNHTEFTIDLYYDKNGDLKSFIPRQRIEVRDGEVNKAVTRIPEFYDALSLKLASVKGFRGCITFQVFVNKSNGNLYGIEINPRFGGGYPLSYLSGGNFPEWLIREYFLHEKIDKCDTWEKDLMMLRYDDEVLVRNAK